jgi:hypothetical protein
MCPDPHRDWDHS